MDALMEKMINRARGLLALSEDETTTQAERDLATSRAAELMAKFSIDAAMLAAKADLRQVPCDRIVKFPDPYAKQHMFLYVAILREFGGDCVIIDSPRRYRENDGITIHVYGFEADLTMVDVLYTSLLLQGVNQSKVVPRYEHARTWRVSFWIGFTNRITVRLREAHKSAETASGEPGTALVLKDRKALVQDRITHDHGKLGKYGSSSARSRDGLSSGHAAGDRANLHNQTSTGGASRHALI
jgi:hypothetical protein